MTGDAAMLNKEQIQQLTALTPGAPDDGEPGRRQRGLAIAALVPTKPDRFGYKVPSQSGNGVYLVNLEHGAYCTCPDFEKNEQPCKHVYAVQAVLSGTETAPPEAVRITQPWSAYNDAQVHEGELFAVLLRELCDTVPQPPQRNGRPRLPLSDMLYGMGLKVYSTLSTRRAMSGIRDAVADGRMQKEPSYSTPIRYFERTEITPILRDLIVASALPLSGIEQDFAIDSSGLASTAYNRWFEHKWGQVSGKKEVKWAKLHVMCGVQSCIVTAADATASMSADSPYLPDFVRITAENFNVREVSADAAYSSRQNLHAVAAVGGMPYIPFRKNAVARPKDSHRADPLWEQMFHHFTLRQADFNRHYHKRSNVETVFHMIKAKFGDKLRAKTDTAMVNEALMRVLCHNICVLIRAMYALGITPVFDMGGSSRGNSDEEPSTLSALSVSYQPTALGKTKISGGVPWPPSRSPVRYASG